MKATTLSLILAAVAVFLSVTGVVYAVRSARVAREAATFYESFQEKARVDQENARAAFARIDNQISQLEVGMQALQNKETPDPKVVLELQKQVPKLREDVDGVLGTLTIADNDIKAEADNIERRCEALEKGLAELVEKLDRRFEEVAKKVGELDAKMADTIERLEAARGAIKRVYEHTQENRDKIADTSAKLQTEVSRLDDEHRLMHYNYDTVLAIQKKQREEAANPPPEPEPEKTCFVPPPQRDPEPLSCNVYEEPEPTAEKEPGACRRFFRGLLRIITFRWGRS